VSVASAVFPRMFLVPLEKVKRSFDPPVAIISWRICGDELEAESKLFAPHTCFFSSSDFAVSNEGDEPMRDENALSVFCSSYIHIFRGSIGVIARMLCSCLFSSQFEEVSPETINTSSYPKVKSSASSTEAFRKQIDRKRRTVVIGSFCTV
jgi:hypothetical protein